MSKSETLMAFEAALKESKELQEKFVAAQKRIVEKNEASSEGELLVKAAAEVGFTLTMAEIERAFAENQELSDEELDNVAGGASNATGLCWKDYACSFVYHHDSTDKDDFCAFDYFCILTFKGLFGGANSD